MGIKRSYLVLYNLVQLVGNVCILTSIVRFNVRGEGLRRKPVLWSGYPIRGTCDVAAPILRIVLSLQWLEILHSLLGLSRGSPIASLIQVGFKSVIYFVFIDNVNADETVRASTAAGCLLFVWSLADSIRYPFYLQTLLHADLFLIKWLRHSAWILLYPIGITLEAVCLYRSIPHIRLTGRLSLSMPNALNLAIDPVPLIHAYLYFGVVLGSYHMLSYMWIQRRRALSLRPKQS